MSGLLLAILLLATATPFLAPVNPAVAQAPKTIVFCTSYGMGDNLLENITDWLESLGHTVKVAHGGINSTFLAGADALILGSPYGGASGIDELNSTNAPTLFTTIKNWFDQGGKFLWVSGDSDYGSRDWIALNASMLLGEVGSSLRIEPASVEDPHSNCGASYRVVANTSETVDPDGAAISAGVNACLFHGPTSIYGVDANGAPVLLENVKLPNVFNIYYTGASAEIVDNNPIIPPVAHTTGARGNWVMMAGQKYAGPFGNNKIIASGAAPYGDYRPMFQDEYYGVVMNGSQLVKNAILWGLTVEAVVVTPPLVFYAAIAGVVIVVVIIVVVILLRRRGG